LVVATTLALLATLAANVASQDCATCKSQIEGYEGQLDSLNCDDIDLVQINACLATISAGVATDCVTAEELASLTATVGQVTTRCPTAIGGDTSGGDTSECTTTITECGTRLGTLGANYVTNPETFCRNQADFDAYINCLDDMAECTASLDAALRGVVDAQDAARAGIIDTCRNDYGTSPSSSSAGDNTGDGDGNGAVTVTAPIVFLYTVVLASITALFQ